MEELKQIYRYPHNGAKQWLRVSEKTNIEVIEGKKYPEHGNLVDIPMAGNGYHGRCENCGLSLVTDLGYNSWEGTKCEVKPENIETIDYKLTWHKSEDKATKMSSKKAHKYFNSLIFEQGWGTYNFRII